MMGEELDLAEGLLALAAGTWLLALMHTPVIGEGQALGGGTPALPALIWLLTCVAALMVGQGRAEAECLAAHTTLTGPVPYVLPLVDQQC